MKTNIVLIGFFKALTKKIGEKLALDFGLYFADIEDLMEYNLSNEKEIEKLCGVDYLNGLKRKVLKDISNYENTLITMPYGIFSAESQASLFRKNCTIVYLNFKKKWLQKKTAECEDKNTKLAGEAFLVAYEERKKFCEDNSDVVINLSKPEFDASYKKVKKYINKYYL